METANSHHKAKVKYLGISVDKKLILLNHKEIILQKVRHAITICTMLAEEFWVCNLGIMLYLM